MKGMVYQYKDETQKSLIKAVNGVSYEVDCSQLSDGVISSLKVNSNVEFELDEFDDEEVVSLRILDSSEVDTFLIPDDIIEVEGQTLTDQHNTIIIEQLDCTLGYSWPKISTFFKSVFATILIEKLIFKHLDKRLARSTERLSANAILRYVKGTRGNIMVAEGKPAVIAVRSVLGEYLIEELMARQSIKKERERLVEHDISKMMLRWFLCVFCVLILGVSAYRMVDSIAFCSSYIDLLNCTFSGRNFERIIVFSPLLLWFRFGDRYLKSRFFLDAEQEERGKLFLQYDPLAKNAAIDEKLNYSYDANPVDATGAEMKGSSLVTPESKTDASIGTGKHDLYETTPINDVIDTHSLNIANQHEILVDAFFKKLRIDSDDGLFKLTLEKRFPNKILFSSDSAFKQMKVIASADYSVYTTTTSEDAIFTGLNKLAVKVQCNAFRILFTAKIKDGDGFIYKHLVKPLIVEHASYEGSDMPSGYLRVLNRNLKECCKPDDEDGIFFVKEDKPKTAPVIAT